jgi:hypothetical protein
VILFLDISSTCTGYCLAEDGKIVDIGAHWFESKYSIAQKCAEMNAWVDWHIEYSAVNRIVYERYSFNMKNPNGALACPHIQGAVLAAGAGLGDNSLLEDITPQTWRKHCGLKKAKTENWKEVTEAHFRAIYDIPDKIESNVTGKLRKTPSDYFDALGICIGWHNMHNIEIKWE